MKENAWELLVYWNETANLSSHPLTTELQHISTVWEHIWVAPLVQHKLVCWFYMAFIKRKERFYICLLVCACLSFFVCVFYASLNIIQDKSVRKGGERERPQANPLTSFRNSLSMCSRGPSSLPLTSLLPLKKMEWKLTLRNICNAHEAFSHYLVAINLTDLL